MRAWFASSISNRFSASAVALTMSIVLTVGLASYFSNLALIDREIRSELSKVVAVQAEQLSAEINHIAQELDMLARNPLVANALTDSFGRETYLAALLNSNSLTAMPSLRLSLADYRGRVIASNKRDDVRDYQAITWLREVTEISGARADLIEYRPGEASLIVAWPIVYPGTGTAEGFLVVETAPDELLTKAVGASSESGTRSLVAGTHVIAAHGSRGPPASAGEFTFLQPLSAKAPFDTLELSLAATIPTRNAKADLLRMSSAYALGGLLLFVAVWYGARRIARRLTAGLSELTHTATRIAEVPHGGIRLPESGEDEVARLSRSFNSVLARLEEYNSQLQRQLDAQLIAAQVFEENLEGIAIANPPGRILAVNRAFSRITGFESGDLVGRSAQELARALGQDEEFSEMARGLRESGVWNKEARLVRKNGEDYVVWLRVTALRSSDGRPRNYVAMLSDISERKRNEAQIQYLATHDSLTGLPNRRLLKERLEQAVLHAKRTGRFGAVLFIDLDRFKRANDTFGHRVGDLILQLVARRLSSQVRRTDTVARVGGDEFAIVLTELKRPTDADLAARKVLNALSQPMKLEAQTLDLGASIGGSVFPADSEDPEMLLADADAAMYRVKDQGRNGLLWYTRTIGEAAQQRLRLESALRKALASNALTLQYQPQICLATGRVTAVEALARWEHPELGQISPSVFIPLAEESDLILALGEWVLRTACAQNRAWQQAGCTPVRIAVNVSARQFHTGSLEKMVKDILSQTGLAAQYLELELTESLLMEGGAAFLQRLRQLKSLGIELAIDDFGTGYSSLSYLNQFPVDHLKIDRSFLRNVGESETAEVIPKAVIALGRSLNLKVTAEGVENERQVAFLRRVQCDAVQGYLFAPPQPAEELEKLLMRDFRDVTNLHRCPV